MKKKLGSFGNGNNFPQTRSLMRLFEYSLNDIALKYNISTHFQTRLL